MPSSTTRPRKLWQRPRNELHAAGDPRFPYVFTTYRLTELHCGGVMSRVTPHTAELQPEAFVELSPELAAELGIEHLGWTVLSTLRGEIEARAMVTERMRPFTIAGRTVHQVGDALALAAGRATRAATSPTSCSPSPGTPTPASTAPRP